MTNNRLCIISGGSIDLEFVRKYLKQEKFQTIIAVDNGLKWCDELGVVPDEIVGDFDTVCADLVQRYEKNENIKIERLNPIKDDSDTEHAMWHAVTYEPDEVVILGATGTRLDHVMANVSALQILLSYHIPAYILDKNNRIRLVQRELVIKKEEQYGQYVSLIPFTDVVKGVTVEGVAYPLEEKNFSKDECYSLGVSNKITESQMHVFIRHGIMMVLETKD